MPLLRVRTLVIHFFFGGGAIYKDYELINYMGVSKNSGTPKWMVYNGKPYENGWFGGTTI